MDPAAAPGQFLDALTRPHCPAPCVLHVFMHFLVAKAVYCTSRKIPLHRNSYPQRADSAVPLLHKAVSVLMIRDSVGFAAVGVAAEKAVSAQQ